MNATREDQRPEVISTGNQKPHFYKGSELLVEDSDHAPDLSKVLKTGFTEDVDTTTETARPVIHETVKPVREHREEQHVVRDIHTHAVHHRILPIVDVQVLPTKHYIQGEDGRLTEINEDQIPTDKQNWVIAETVSRDVTTENAPAITIPTRTFADKDEDINYVGKDGIPRTETTWRHAPRVQHSVPGQTSAMHHVSNHGQAVRLNNSGIGSSGSHLESSENMQRFQKDAEALVTAARSTGAIEEFPGSSEASPTHQQQATHHHPQNSPATKLSSVHQHKDSMNIEPTQTAEPISLEELQHAQDTKQTIGSSKMDDIRLQAKSGSNQTNHTSMRDGATKPHKSTTQKILGVIGRGAKDKKTRVSSADVKTSGESEDTSVGAAQAALAAMTIRNRDASGSSV